jgi:hypothetical protein
MVYVREALVDARAPDLLSSRSGTRGTSRGGRVEEEEEDRSIDPSKASPEAIQILPMGD